MAAPAETSVHALSGQWKINSKLSQDIGPVLELQEVPWLVRTLITKAAVSVILKQSEEGGISKIESNQTSLGRAVAETWVLNWEPINSTHAVFGKMVVKARFSAPKAVEEEILQGHSESYEADWEGDVIELYVEGEGWTSTQVWGFTTVEGTRRYARRSVVKKGDKSKVVQVIYDWVAPLE